MILPGVKPWVQIAADEVSERFRPSTILGVGLRGDNPSSDHPKGLAIDCMVGSDKAKGNAIAAYLIANASRLGITYVIWDARIWEGGKWAPYRHPSGGTSPTQLHRDHVHGSFRATAPTGGGSPTETPQGFVGNPITGAKNTLTALNDALTALTDPHRWLRMAMMTAGMVLVLIGLLTMDKVKAVAQTATKGVTRAVAKS